MPSLSALATRPSRRRHRRRTISLTAFQGRQRRARLLHVCVTFRYRSAAFLGTIIKRGTINRWRAFYGSRAVLKSPRDCTMLGSSMRRVGLIDITAGNATRLGASQRSATRRCASQHIATQRLSRWESPAARARYRPWLRDAYAAGRRLKPRKSDNEGAS